MPNINFETKYIPTRAEAERLVPHLRERAKMDPDASEMDWWVHNVMKAYAEARLLFKEEK